MSTERHLVANLHRDQRGIVAAFMLRLILVLTLIGIVFVEGGAIVFSKLQAQDVAESAAVAGATSWWHTRSPDTARKQAVLLMEDKSPRAKMTAFTLNPDGSVSVTVRLQANTILIQHVGFLEDYTVSRATATAQPPNPDV
ncbi:MAG TPA: pilus assembly protein TadG-related protein [Actinomycetota bacterium]|nr:pilus assembly protein TadG-related protein [Actinomycetota bacterium]